VPNSKPASPQHAYTGLRTSRLVIEPGHNPPYVKRASFSRAETKPSVALASITSADMATPSPTQEDEPLDLSCASTFKRTGIHTGSLSSLSAVSVEDEDDVTTTLTDHRHVCDLDAKKRSRSTAANPGKSCTRDGGKDRSACDSSGPAQSLLPGVETNWEAKKQNEYLHPPPIPTGRKEMFQK
jgi:hypothetical protein